MKATAGAGPTCRASLNSTRDGAARRDDRGKVQYTPVVQFLVRDTGDAFSERVIEAVLKAYPRAFDAEERVE
jgi:hypothetical protein